MWPKGTVPGRFVVDFTTGRRLRGWNAEDITGSPMTTPNKITIARICLIPVFVMMALYYGRSVAHGAPEEWMRWTAVAVFVLAAASDGIDGYIARHYNQMSQLGVILDPIADKGLLLSGIITLSISNWAYEIPLWFPVLVISRDILVVIGVLAVHYMTGGVKVRPSWMGKTATVSQMVAIGFVMLWPTNPWRVHLGSWEMKFLDIPVIIAGVFCLISGVGYIRRGLSQVHAAGHGEPRRPDEMW
jgi:cardiolipin synthase